MEQRASVFLQQFLQGRKTQKKDTLTQLPNVSHLIRFSLREVTASKLTVSSNLALSAIITVYSNINHFLDQAQTLRPRWRDRCAFHLDQIPFCERMR